MIGNPPRPGPGVAPHSTAIIALIGAGMFTSCAPARDGAAFDPVEATIAGVHTAIRAGDVTCREVVQAYLDRIAAYEDRLNAITVLDPAALARADSLDRSLAAGEEQGPLFCVPMLVKDNFDTHDMVTTGGSIALASSVPPTTRSWCGGSARPARS